MSNAITAPREWLNGIRKLTAVKIHAQARRTRRGPRSPPRYTENGPMNIIDALNEVLIHDASSIPRWSAPRMSARPTLINRPVHVAIIAPSSTPATPSTGCVVRVGEAAGALASGLVIDHLPVGSQPSSGCEQ